LSIWEQRRFFLSIDLRYANEKSESEGGTNPQRCLRRLRETAPVVEQRALPQANENFIARRAS
jgi:hypothetical protein